MTNLKVIVFTCNWNAYSGMETAGVERLRYPAFVYPIKVMCLGQISPGVILKAFEKGASGVLLLGCPSGMCHFEFGNRRVEEVFDEAKGLATVLGYQDEQICLDWVAAGEGFDFVEKVQRFVSGLNGGQEKQ